MSPLMAQGAPAVLMTVGGSWGSKWRRVQLDKREQGELVGGERCLSTGEGGIVPGEKEASSQVSQSGQVQDQATVRS